MYAPSKGFRKYPARFKSTRWLGQTFLPTELGFQVNMLAFPAGVAEPEGLRHEVGRWKDGSPILEADEILSRKAWNGVVRTLRLLSTPTGIKTLNVVSQENALSRKAQKAAKFKVKTRVSLRAKRLIKANPALTQEQAMLQAEDAFGEALKGASDKGKPSYHYAEPRFDSHNLLYSLQDNRKTRRIVKLKGKDAQDYLAALKA